ncbi:MAG TPA: hypothetical protein PKE19_00615 [Aestuariivirga sp.]|nr:hypothetical protein [Aestuariivirga sp.]
MRIAAALILAASQLTAVPFVSALATNEARHSTMTQPAGVHAGQSSHGNGNVTVFHMTPASRNVTIAVQAQETNTAPL